MHESSLICTLRVSRAYVCILGFGEDTLQIRPFLVHMAIKPLISPPGTHLRNTSEAGAFALVSEEAVAKGVRRVIAVTKDEAAAAIKNGQGLEQSIEAAGSLKGRELEKVTRGTPSIHLLV
jgi:hypothetical protein